MTALRNRLSAAIGIFIVLAISAYSLRDSYSLSAVRAPDIIRPSTQTEESHLDKPQQSSSSTSSIVLQSQAPPSETPHPAPPPPAEEPKEKEHVIPDHPTYKSQLKPSPPTVDNFPFAATVHSAAELPPIPPWNQPPSPHVPEKTPLFIGFTRNWRLLQQTVVGFVTAGWPPEDIYVIENTGVMRSNELGLLSSQNPFFLNHTRLHMFGVNIVTTPTLLSFSQLQNFYIWMAIQNNYTTYFYAHMDVIVLPYEQKEGVVPDNDLDRGVPNEFGGFKSIYLRAVDALRLAVASATDPDPNSSNTSKPWAARFFSYDRLTLVNREAYESIGGWDTAIPYYFSDCDMHDRLKMYGFEYNGPDVEIGDFFDVSRSLDDLLVLYRKKEQHSVQASFTVEDPPTESETEKNGGNMAARMEKSMVKRAWESDDLGSDSYSQIRKVGDELARLKNSGDPGGRNTWQSR